MQDLVRWFLEIAPNVAVGLTALAFVRAFAPFIVQRVATPWFSRKDDDLNAHQAKLRAIKDLPPEQRQALDLMSGFAERAAPIVLRGFATVAYIAISIWLFIAVWTVTGELDSMWGQTIVWIGVTLGAVNAAVSYSMVRKFEGPEKYRRWMRNTWLAVSVFFAVVYAFAPLGCLFYTAIVWVLSHGLGQIGSKTGKAPTVASAFVGF